MAFSGTYLSQISLNAHNNFGSKSPQYGHIYAYTLKAIPPRTQQQSTSLDNNISSGSDSGQTNDSDEYTESPYPGILDADMTALTNGQKHFFIVTVSLLFLLSVVGNVSTLIVNFRRKIRPFFRACLISLAFGDLMNTLFLSLAYLSQFIEEYVQIWSLGPLMCSVVPFATTAAILASSMTLVGIAVDRYYAVIKAVVGFWNPTLISCIVSMLCIWLASIGIASPVFFIYNSQPVYILTEEHAGDASVAKTVSAISAEGGYEVPARISNRTSATGTTITDWEVDASQEDLPYLLIRERRLADICISEKKEATLYYVIVFVIIFIPCIGAFFWFNIIIARKLWNRRHSVTTTNMESNLSKMKPHTKTSTLKSRIPQVAAAQQLDLVKPPNQKWESAAVHTSSTAKPSRSGTTTTTTTATNSCNATSTPANATRNNSREARHLRMFTIILLMMVVFLFLRLPAWIFLLMRLYGFYNTTTDWILYFAFGIMNLASSVLNPLLYTFLMETIKYALNFKAKVTTWICNDCTKFWCCCHTSKGLRVQKSVPMTNIREPPLTLSCCEGLCVCSGFLCTNWRRKQTQSMRKGVHTTGYRADEYCGKDSNDKDEGIDCGDNVEHDMAEHNLYDCRIYTIYPTSGMPS